MIDYLPPKQEEYLNILNSMYNKNSKQITFQITENCNLKCTYCYQHHKTQNKMSFELIQPFIDKLLNDEIAFCNTNNTETIILDFIGGEPFLEIDLINTICSYILDIMIQKQHPWLNLFKINICSNGTLYFNSNVQYFIKKFNYFLFLTISIDGNKELHDKCRIDNFGKGTYDKAIAAVQHYKKYYNTQINTKLTLVPENLLFLYDAIIDLIDKGYTQIHANCAFENLWHIQDAQNLYDQMTLISDYLINNNLYNKINCSLFDENLFTPLTINDNNNFCGGLSNNNLAINYQGEIFTCIRFMDTSLNFKQKALPIGNITHGLLSSNDYINNYNSLSNITRKSQSSDECFYCPIAKGCGWCSAFNYEETGSANKRVTYLCIMHQARALANMYHWNNLYKQLNIQKEFKLVLPKNNILLQLKTK